MSLAYVILGLLQQQERTGYDLKTDCFNHSIAHLWPADQAQIYRTLEKLETQGWITCTVQIQQDRPNRKIYRLTEQGHQEFLQWLQTHQELPTLREPLLVQLHFGSHLPTAMLVQLLTQELADRQKKLSDCEALQDDFEAEATRRSPPSTDREQLLQQLVFDLVERREQAYLDWLEQAIATLQNHPD